MGSPGSKLRYLAQLGEQPIGRVIEGVGRRGPRRPSPILGTDRDIIPEKVTSAPSIAPSSGRDTASSGRENTARGYTFPEGNVASLLPLVLGRRSAFGLESTPLDLGALLNVPSQWDN